MLREWFEKIRYPFEALSFFRFVGDFVHCEMRSHHEFLSWSEFRRWQDIVRWLRRRKPWDGFLQFAHSDDEEKEELKQHPEYFQGLTTPELFPEFIDQIWRVSDSTIECLNGFPPGITVLRDTILPRKDIERIFSNPKSRIIGSSDREEAIKRFELETRRRAIGNSEGKQRLIGSIFVTCALDAILATIYLDKLQGLDTGVCGLKDCKQIFVRTSKHKRKFCCHACAHHASVLKHRPKRGLKKSRRRG